ncbi:MAG: 3-hydroxybutyryl-CoA dehydrogenase [Nakamurella sp.]
MNISRIGVVGGGLMGSGIAEVCARSGLDVVVAEADEGAADAARARIEKSFARGVEKGKITADQSESALGRLRVVASLDDLVDRQWVIEAATENEPVKLALFRRLDEVVADADAILASNTSSIPIARLAAVTGRPDKVVGMHFFNPATVQKLVEVIPSQLTSDETIAAVTALATDTLGKTVIRAKDRAGFVVNALLIPYMLSAIRMVEAGHASAEDIDTGMVLGCAHPMGPLALTDLVGLDTTLAVAESLHAEYAEPTYAPPPLLRRMVESGMLGRKSGRGFYTYS